MLWLPGLVTGRSALDAGTAVSWTTVFDGSATLNGTTDGNGNGGWTTMAIFNPGSLTSSSSKTQCRLTIRFGSDSGSTGTPNTFYFGQGDTAPGDAYDFNTTPAAVTFTGIAAGANAQFVSDAFALPETYDAAQPYICCWFTPVGSNASVAYAGLGTGNLHRIAFKETTTTDSATVDKSGYGIADDTGLFVTKIEVAA